ncbi:MAG: hypothetical protein OQK69_01580 [Gammaproteobacteria bacterium]|nr:hypothetical protein [Gammaproteobacteria bacterium]
MLTRVQFYFLFPVVLLLASCSIIEEKQPDSRLVRETEELSAWRLSASEKRMVSSNHAVGLLLKQADDLMAEANFEQAGDKLERLVRIEPKFAQAWSRLAWMALERGDAKRSHQLAQRSNSYSRDNTNLRILNWRFIQKAGELLNDAGIVQRARKMLKKLGND